MLVRLLPVLLLACAAIAQNVAFQGTVINTSDQQPLPGVHVQLVPAGYPAAKGEVYGAISDRTGHFSMAAVPPGAYLLHCERNGFAPPNAARARGAQGSVTLKSGQNITDYKVEMMPRAIIAGRVVDAYGDPVPNVQVRIQPVTAADGQFGTGFARTDDRGEFRESGRPGRYYIEAMPGRGGGFGGRMGRPEVRSDGSRDLLYTMTWFPDSPSKDHAKAIEVKAGEVNDAIEIRLAQTQNLMISGQITGIPEPGNRISIALMSIDADDHVTGSTGSSADPQGRFTFSRVQPGTYKLVAQWSKEKTRLISLAQRIQVDSADVTNVALALAPAGEITGTLEIAGARPGSSPAGKFTIALNPVDFFMFDQRQSDPVIVDKDGGFHATNIAPVRYRVNVSPLPENAYIKTVVVDGTPVSGGWKPEIDFSGGVRSSTLKIIVSLKGAEIAGTIRDRNGAELSDAVLHVYLANDPKDLKNAMSTPAKPDGSYRFTGVPPGKYRVCAIDLTKHPDVKGEISPELVAKAEEIEVKESDRITQNVTPLEDNTHAKPAP